MNVLYHDYAKSIGLSDEEQTDFLYRKREAFVKEKIAPLVQAEERSFERLDEVEREQLLAITQKHIGLLEEEINRIEQMSSED